MKFIVFQSKYFHILMAAIPIILVLLPSNFFDSGDSMCLSKLIANSECYACGMTRGVMHLLHFDFETAWHFNKLSYLVTPLLGFLWLKSIYVVIDRKPPTLFEKLF